MFIAKVVGSVVSSVKDAGLSGKSLLIVENVAPDGQTQATSDHVTYTHVAVDTIGAGKNDLVLVVTGSSARATVNTSPVDAAIVGIIDSNEVNGEFVYQAN